jgi:hypothetical protein
MNLNELSNSQIVAIGVARLGGDVRAVDTEDVAMEIFKLAPKRFSWKKYPDIPDLHTARVALADAQRVDPPLLVGGIKDGWMLSPEGVKWITSLLDGEGEGIALDDTEKAKRGSVYALKEAEKARLRRTSAFLRFHSNNVDDISLTDFYEFVRINEYFPLRKRRERLAAIENVVLDEPKLEAVWRFLKIKFSQELSSDED